MSVRTGSVLAVIAQQRMRERFQFFPFVCCVCLCVYYRLQTSIKRLRDEIQLSNSCTFLSDKLIYSLYYYSTISTVNIHTYVFNAVNSRWEHCPNFSLTGLHTHTHTHTHTLLSPIGHKRVEFSLPCGSGVIQTLQ